MEDFYESVFEAKQIVKFSIIWCYSVSWKLVVKQEFLSLHGFYCFHKILILCKSVPVGLDTAIFIFSGVFRIKDKSAFAVHRYLIFRSFRLDQLRGFPRLFGGDLFLLDEPFAALDEQLRHDLAKKLKEYLHARGASAILVTHNREDAEIIADRIVTLS